MSNKNVMDQAKAEQMVESIRKWLLNRSPSSTAIQQDCFGTMEQDFAIDFAQQLFDSVGLPTDLLFKLALSLKSETEVEPEPEALSDFDVNLDFDVRLDYYTKLDFSAKLNFEKIAGNTIH